MIQRLQLVDQRLLAPAQTAVALKRVSKMDLLRLKVIARLHARGLPPDVGWDDLIQEALTRVLVGNRKLPEGVSMVAFIAGVMRSLRSEHWQRALKGRGIRSTAESVDRSPGPERRLIAQQELIYITDDEIREAVREMGMNPDMKGSAAFVGLNPVGADLAEFFFGMKNVAPLLAEANRARTLPASKRRRPRPKET